MRKTVDTQATLRWRKTWAIIFLGLIAVGLSRTLDTDNLITWKNLGIFAIAAPFIFKSVKYIGRDF